MTARELWEAYSSHENIDAPYEAWSFGPGGDALAALVASGIKTATSSAFSLYEQEAVPLPRAGEYGVILNSAGEALCIIRTERVFVAPFEAVDEIHAWREGEGDRSLSYWRQVHEAFFRRELQAANLEFSWKMPVVCEEFVRVYP